MKFEGVVSDKEIVRVCEKAIKKEVARLESKLSSYEKYLNKFYEELKALRFKLDEVRTEKAWN